MTAAKNDPQVQIKRIIGVLPNGQDRRLYVDRRLFDQVCRSYAVDPRNASAGIKLLDVVVRPFDFVEITV